MRKLAIAAFVALGGCNTTAETVRLQVKPQQEAVLRAGQSTVVSRQKNSTVAISPVTRQTALGTTAVLMVEITNTSARPISFRVADAAASQVIEGQGTRPLRVYTQAQLVVHDPAKAEATGAVTHMGGPYVPAVASGYWRKAPSSQNPVLVAALTEPAARSFSTLEALTATDHTLRPGETYIGDMFIEPLVGAAGTPKPFVIDMQVGQDRHLIEAVQAAAGAV